MSTLKQRIETSIRNNPTHTNYKIAKNLRGTTTKMVADVRATLSGLKSAPVAVAAPAKPSRSRRPHRTFSAFQAANDVTHIIARKVAELLPPDGEEYYTDHEFREACEVGIGSWRRFADDDQFSAYRLVRGQHNYWAPKPMVPKMKLILGV